MMFRIKTICIKYHYAEFCKAEFHNLFNVMLNVVILNVVAPFKWYKRQLYVLFSWKGVGTLTF